ncbi:MAG: transglycosylase SLT domain-containing protein [Bacteroidota bacterium]
MFATTNFPPAIARASSVVIVVLRKLLMLAGLVFLVGLVGVQTGRLDLAEGLRALVPSVLESAAADEGDDDELPAEAQVEAEASIEVLSPRMRGALDYVSRRYRVSTEALQPIFSTVQAAGRDLHLDPLLIIAVIGVESGFNPFSQSVMGAQGLMQVMPRFHLDKLPEESVIHPFLDPVTNVQVGARVLQESIRRYGGVEDGLQQFAGAVNDPERRYSSRVLAEKLRLEQAVQRLRTT